MAPSVSEMARKDEEGTSPLWLKVFEKLGAIESRLTGVENHLAEQNGSVKSHAQWIAEQRGRLAYKRWTFEIGLVFAGALLGFAVHLTGFW